MGGRIYADVNVVSLFVRMYVSTMLRCSEGVLMRSSVRDFHFWGTSVRAENRIGTIMANNSACDERLHLA